MEAILKLFTYIAAINVFTYAVFAIDKRQAESAGRRIPEATLLQLALVGGSIGAKLAERRLRHKTRKEPFRTRLNMIATFHAAIWLALMVPSVRASAFEAITDITRAFAGAAPFKSETERVLPRRFGPGSHGMHIP